MLPTNEGSTFASKSSKDEIHKEGLIELLYTIEETQPNTEDESKGLHHYAMMAER